MDPEQTFLRVHARLSGMLSQLLTPRIRLALEYVYLAVALALFGILVVMHTNFVQQPGCSSLLSRIELTETQLVQIKIISGGLWSRNLADQNMEGFQKHGSLNERPPDVSGDGFTIMTAKFWSNWIDSGVTKSKSIAKYQANDQEFHEPQVENAADTSITRSVTNEVEIITDTGGLHIGFPPSTKESFKAAIAQLRNKWHMRITSFWKNTKQFVADAGRLWNIAGWNAIVDISKCLQMLHAEHLSSFIVQWLERRSEAFEPTYLYTLEKSMLSSFPLDNLKILLLGFVGYFLLSEAAKVQHNVRTINVTISAQNSCFGNRWQQLLINSFVGYDTILMNSLLSHPGQGYLYNFQTKEFYDLSYGHEPSEGPARFGDYFVTKCGVLIMSLFVFFTTTMSVSFTLRETQSRMLKFTVQLQHHARHQLPTFQLIFVHVIESLVFVPIMIGILFFLFEFYDDQLLAFLVLTLVWLCELFTMISVRTSISMQFFPRFFLLYFLVFHIYFFSYAYGFSYLAFSATAAFMQHLILYFWNRFEVPALQRSMRSRGQLQQPVQITSSTIYASTLHIARVNVRNTGIVNDELDAGPETHSRPDRTIPDLVEHMDGTGDQQQSARGGQDTVRNPLQHPVMNPQHTESANSSGLLNQLGSFLLWLLGGASSDVIVSFFSMFRDVRDHRRVYQEPTRAENEPVT